jgi:hypothetical protein
MENALKQFLNKEDVKKVKKKKVTVKEGSEIIEVVEKTILVEDGRQLLND